MDQGSIERLVIAGVTFLIALMSILPSFLKARATDAQAQSRKESLEADNMKFVLTTANQFVVQSGQMMDIQKELAAALQREIVKNTEIARLTAELEVALHELEAVKKQLQSCTELVERGR